MLGQTFIQDFNVLQLSLLELKNQDLTLIFNQFFLECLEDVYWSSQIGKKYLFLAFTEEWLNFALEN